MLFRLPRIHLRPHRRPAALLGVLQLLQILGTLSLPTLGAAIIDYGVVKDDSGYIAWTGLVALMVVLGMTFGFILSRADPFYARMLKYLDRVNGLLRERITGARVVRAFVRYTHEAARFDRTNSELQVVSLRVQRLLATIVPSFSSP